MRRRRFARAVSATAVFGTGAAFAQAAAGLPAIYGFQPFALDGGLMSYSIDFADQFHRAAVVRRCGMQTTHAFADHIGLRVVESRPGHSVCAAAIAAHHLNPHGVVHGAVLFALADTGMGAALYPHLRSDQSCTTISAQIGYLAAARAGELRCETSVVRLGRTVAHLESRVLCDGKPVATASGQYAITARTPP